MLVLLRTAVLGAALALAGAAGPARAEEPGTSAVAGTPAAAAPDIIGRWAGSKLRCQKDEGKLVRCGTPSPSEIIFAADGTGSTPDENLPPKFTWRWLSPAEIAVVPAGGGTELKFFSLEREEDSLTFQVYLYPPATDPSVPAESRYVHFVFDVSRAD